jgi:hypothetical protein
MYVEGAYERQDGVGVGGQGLVLCSQLANSNQYRSGINLPGRTRRSGSAG